MIIVQMVYLQHIYNCRDIPETCQVDANNTRRRSEAHKEEINSERKKNLIIYSSAKYYILYYKIRYWIQLFNTYM